MQFDKHNVKKSLTTYYHKDLYQFEYIKSILIFY